jgi:hypothetical protein
MSAQIVQIVPRLAPSISGVADYAGLLAQRLSDDYQIDSSFLVGDPAWQGPARLDRFSVARIDGQQPHELERRLVKLGADWVLLHYVGYGYQKRGCPIWLVHGLMSWKRKNPRRRLVVMFHELFACGRPWQSSFWTSPLQRSLAKSLALLSDHRVTNLTRSAQALAAMTGRSVSEITVLPVFSNVGESPAVNDLSSRLPTAVIFAGARWLGQLAENFRALTVKSCRRLGIEKLISIGSPAGSAPAEFPIPIEEHGYLPAERIRQLLSECRFGLVDYYPGYLAKSGVFAAYAALGCVPLLICENGSELDGCVTGKNCLVMERLPNQITDDRLQQVADNAMAWYRSHDLAHTARLYAATLRS